MLEALTLVPSKPKPKVLSGVESVAGMDEYMKVAATVGVHVPDRLRESKLAQVLHALDYPVYNHDEVVKYMERKAKRDGAEIGWGWRALRVSDVLESDWGTRAVYREDKLRKRCSDSFLTSRNGRAYTAPYGHAIPLHALQRIAAIEAAYPPLVGGVHGDRKYSFHVSDYAMKDDALHERPDPFLMVVDRTVRLSKETMFIIDFWDEPGFGLEQMLK